MNDVTRIDRTCAACACFHIQENPLNPLHRQGFCRLNPPMHAQGKVEQARLGPDKKIVMAKDGKTPIMETAVKDFYLYPPTMPELTCFSGFRPTGAQPGDKWNPEIDVMMDNVMSLITPVLASMGVVLVKPPLDG